MIWESIALMTIIDLLIIALSLLVFINFYKYRNILIQLKIIGGFRLIIFGFFVMALLYVVDLMSMHLFPLFMPMSEAMAIMTNLHLNYSFVVSATGFCFFVAGIMYLYKIVFPEMISYQKKLHTTSITDELTGLLNRRGFFELSKKHCEIANRNNLNLYFLFLDIDGMKDINDKYGHIEGDMVLKTTSTIFAETFRSSDIIARIGGDEFVIMTLESPEISIEKLTKRLKSNIDAYNKMAKNPYMLSVSMGLVPYDPAKPCSVDKLIAMADKEMYKDKNNHL